MPASPTVSLVVAFVLALAPGSPEDDQARAASYVVAAEAAFEAGGHAEAAAWLARAYALDPKPEYLLGQAQAERLGGNCQLAVPLYERYLETGPSAEQVEMVDANIARCEALLGDPAEPSVAEPPPEPVPPPVVSPPVIVQADAEPRRDALGWGLAGGGALLSVGGLSATVAGAIVRSNADRARTEDAFDRDLRRSRVTMAIGGVVATIGVAVLVAGIVRLARGRR